MSKNSDEVPLSSDLLVGAKAAVEYVGLTPRVIYDLVDKGFLPVVKVGGGKNTRLFFRKSILNDKFMPPEAA